ncbi:PQ-loop repeat family protein / transmembrane family protein isoform 2 [Hibiscus syriacus]|uniref:PQ-loop repeat family protein / transmembrane family protein isoform 2 n=1 Tax=Hibiscus syriacus TaxID=106335 RepID=A0A6A2Z2A9_HIBSY|nr:PQ-loop repeat family protein / transmembrane family protein isoform 2 [Hibiscus syriacus]
MNVVEKSGNEVERRAAEGENDVAGVAKSGTSAMELDHDSSSEDESAQVSSKKSGTQPMPIPRSAASYGTFLAASISLPLGSKAWMEAGTGFICRRLLQEHGMEHSALGQWLGWLMAAVYMGGRIPQIWLNIKRGSVEGLNPLMFIFALIANAAYVARSALSQTIYFTHRLKNKNVEPVVSQFRHQVRILVRSSEWENIKPNMPWLLDAAVCVALDLFIISQYIYYKYFRETVNIDGDYMEESKEAE